MSEFIIWSNELKQFSESLTLKEMLKDICETWDIYEVEECDYFEYIGIDDITDRKIYADSSIVEFTASGSHGYSQIKGYFHFSKIHLKYIIRTFTHGSFDFNKQLYKNFKIIDTIQENKLGLIK